MLQPHGKMATRFPLQALAKHNGAKPSAAGKPAGGGGRAAGETMPWASPLIKAPSRSDAATKLQAAFRGSAIRKVQRLRREQLELWAQQ